MKRWFPLTILPIICSLIIPFSAEGLDLGAAFSRPEAPDAGEIKGITVFNGTTIVPLSDGTVKVYTPTEPGGTWTRFSYEEVFDRLQVLSGITMQESPCAATGVDTADMMTANILVPNSIKLHRLAVNGSFFDEISSVSISGNFLISGLGSAGCILAWLEETPVGERIYYETPTESGNVLLRGEPGSLLEGLNTEAERVRGMELTKSDAGNTILLLVTDEALYEAEFAGDETLLSSYPLNHRPAFTGENSLICVRGEGAVQLEVTVDDADQDPVTIIQTNDEPGFDGQQITHDCQSLGTVTWSFAITDGNIGDAEMEERDYTITVIDHPSINNFSVAPMSGTAPLDVVFTYQVSGIVNPLACWFDFNGDGFVDTSVDNCTSGTIAHTYPLPGDVEVILTVVDLQGRQRSDTVRVEVN